MFSVVICDYGGVKMKKVELLSPVGNRDCLEAAIKGGADAVYLSGKNFGARKFAGNFTNSELVEAIDYSHLYGVKVYVTVNTIIYQNEMEEVFEYLKFLYENNVDAVIVQDIGIMKLIHERLPNLEVHASTQAHNHNKYGIGLLKELGIKRVVLDREMSLDEVKNIDVDIEKEVFVHGALCVCYSGCCLFSSMNGGRSGNRGECVQSCRLPYRLIKDKDVVNTKGNYILSTRELNTLSKIKDLIESGIDSFKIEGRMKSPSYVGIVTRLYREYIDRYYNNLDMKVKEEDIEKLKKLFNRKFTLGYLNKDKDIMNIETPNHQGIEIGKVIDVNKYKITIKLDKELKQNDGIRFKNSDKGMMVNKLYNKNNLLINSGKNIVILDNKIGLRERDVVLKTIDYELENSFYDVDDRKVKANYYVRAYLGKQLVITLDDGVNRVSYTGDIVEESISSPISKEKIEYQLSKLGDTIYKVNDINIDMDDNIFISIKSLNEIRRYLVSELNKNRIGKKREFIVKEINSNVSDTKNKSLGLNVLVRNREQIKACIDNYVDSIYVTDYDLYLEYKDIYKDIYYRTSRVNNSYKDLNVDKVLVTELGSVSKYKDKEKVSDYYLNICNSNSISYLDSLGVERVTLSVENDYNYLKDIDFSNYNVEVIIYGKVELMVMKYCPLKLNLNNCSNCRLDNSKYYIEDKDKNRYPIVRDNCLIHIMDSKNIDKIEFINEYIDIGINNFRLELFDEDYKMVSDLIKNIKERLGK